MPLEATDEYTGDGSSNDWTVTFGYLKKSHVSLFVDGVEDQTFTWLDATSIAATTVPASGAEILITRTTPRDALVYEIPNSGSYKGADLNNQALQALYIAAEGYDALANTIGLDTGDNKWDAATKRIKNVVDPVDAQDVATKNYADTNGSSYAAQALTSATAAASSESNAATSASTASTAATTASTAATTATTQASNAATSATTASTQATNAANDASYAEEWANKAEDSLVSAAAGGDLVDDYSALHFANKAAASATAAAASAVTAAAAVAGINPPEAARNADELLRGEDGVALHFLSRDYRIIDYTAGALDAGPAQIDHNAPFTMTTNTSLTVTNRGGGVEALSANEVPWDHDASGDAVQPLGMYCANGNHYMTEATIGSTFNIDDDNFTIYCEFMSNSNTGTQDIVDLYTTGVTTDAWTLMNDAGTLKLDVWSATVNTHTLSFTTLSTDVAIRAAFSVDRSGQVRRIMTGMSAVSTTSSLTVPAATPTDLRLGFSLNGWLRKFAHYNRSFSNEELKLICGIS